MRSHKEGRLTGASPCHPLRYGRMLRSLSSVVLPRAAASLRQGPVGAKIRAHRPRHAMAQASVPTLGRLLRRFSASADGILSVESLSSRGCDLLMTRKADPHQPVGDGAAESNELADLLYEEGWPTTTAASGTMPWRFSRDSRPFSLSARVLPPCSMRSTGLSSWRRWRRSVGRKVSSAPPSLLPTLATLVTLVVQPGGRPRRRSNRGVCRRRPSVRPACARARSRIGRAVQPGPIAAGHRQL